MNLISTVLTISLEIYILKQWHAIEAKNKDISIIQSLALGAGHDTPGKVLFQYLDGIPKFVSILKKKDFDNILNNWQDKSRAVSS